MKKRNKIIIVTGLLVLIGIILFIWYTKYNQNKPNDNVENLQWENITNLYLNNGNNEIKDIPSQIDE
jgi:uncharacterized membrane protein YvbJ